MAKKKEDKKVKLKEQTTFDEALKRIAAAGKKPAPKKKK